MAKKKKVRGFVELDFHRYFPGKTWVSNWSKDRSYPDGFCYKLMTVRDAKSKTVEMVLVLQTNDGSKEEMLRCTAPVSEATAVAAQITNHMASTHRLSFEEHDFSRIRTLRGYIAATQRHGWTWRPPTKAER